MDADGINVGQQAPAAVITVFALNYLKNAKWFPWLNENSATLQRVISALVALGTASGMKVIGSSAAGFDIHIPPIPVLVDTLLHAATQFGGQEILHWVLENAQSTKSLQAELATIKQLLSTPAPPQGGQLKP